MARRCCKSPTISPKYSSGVVMSSFMIGSSKHGPPACSPFSKASTAAMRNAVSSEFSRCASPPVTVTFSPVSGKLPIGPPPSRTQLQLLHRRRRQCGRHVVRGTEIEHLPPACRPAPARP